MILTKGKGKSNEKNIAIMANFLTGVLTGVAIGLLTAPRSGKETREKLTGAVNKQTDDLKGQWDKTVSQARETLDSVRSQAGIFADKAENKVDEYKNKAENKVDEYKSDTNSAYQKEKAKGEYNDAVDDAADKTKSGVNKMEDAFKIN